MYAEAYLKLANGKIRLSFRLLQKPPAKTIHIQKPQPNA